MTNKEYLVAQLGFQPQQNSIDAALIDAGITGSATYDTTFKSSLNECAIKLLQLLLSTPDQRNENGFLIEYDRKAIKDRIATLSGVTVGKPTVKAVSKW